MSEASIEDAWNHWKSCSGGTAFLSDDFGDVHVDSLQSPGQTRSLATSDRPLSPGLVAGRSPNSTSAVSEAAHDVEYSMSLLDSTLASSTFDEDLDDGSLNSFDRRSLTHAIGAPSASKIPWVDETASLLLKAHDV